MIYYYYDGKSYLALKHSLETVEYVEDGVDENGEPKYKKIEHLPKGYKRITEEEYKIGCNKIQSLNRETYEKAIQITKWKSELASTDYKCLKFIDGDITEEEYAPIRKRREELRKLIRELE